MPNIELHGFEHDSETTRTCIFVLIEKKAQTVNIDDVVVTIIPSVVQNREGKSCPFVRVVSTNREDRRVGRLIREYMGLDVEWLHLDGFFEGNH